MPKTMYVSSIRACDVTATPMADGANSVSGSRVDLFISRFIGSVAVMEAIA